MSAQQHRASRCVFVGNIPYDATEEQLVQICEEVGPVVSFRLVVDRDTGKPKGYGFCEFRDEETALSARRNLQGYDINGRQLRVDFAENEKGGGGVDRNREQGRGGPGFQQSASHLDAQKQGGGGGLQPGYGGGAPAPPEQPIGRAAASAAALMMAGALGGAQQVPNMMMPPQVPMQAMNVPSAPVNGPLGGNGVPGGPDALTNHLAGMSKHQLYEVMSQMKIMIQQNQLQARQILVANPQLTKALFQAQIMLGMVRPPQGVASQSPQAQQLAPSQQPVIPQQQLQPPPPRPPLQPLPPPPAQMQSQPSNKNNFPPLPQPQQQQLQAPPPPPPSQHQQQQQQQQMPPPPPPQGSFQGGMVQTSLGGMGFQQGPPPPPNQPPPQQHYQMGSNMMGGNVSRMGANNSGGPAGQGNGGVLSSAGTMGPAGTGQIPRGGVGLGNMDSRGVQLNAHLPVSSGVIGGMSGVHGQNPLQGGGHPLGSGNGGGSGGLGQHMPGNMPGAQLMGDPNSRGGYTGMSSQMNANMNPGVNVGMNSGLNPALNNTGMPQGLNQGLNQGFNPALNAGMNLGMNSGLHSNMTVGGINPGMNPGLSMGLNAPPMGSAFAGTTDGTSVTTAALQQPQQQAYNQLQGAPAAQQLQGQIPLELEQQKALLQQVMSLTTDQIMSLPPDQRNQVFQLQQALQSR